MPTVLLVEDEKAIAETVLYALGTEGFVAHHVTTGGKGLDWLQNQPCDLVILDIGLPDLSGFDVCRQLRTFTEVPVLFLTARDSEIDQLLGLELGADDYVTKPFSPRAVVARVRAILRRGNPNGTNSQAKKKRWLHHDKEAMTVHCSGHALDLTAHEYKVLSLLLANPGRTFTRDQILMQAWQDPGSAMDRTIDAHIKTLRAKLRKAAPDRDDPIQTRRGIGYCLNL